MSKCWYCNNELTTANYCEDHMGICNKCYDEMFSIGNALLKKLQTKKNEQDKISFCIEQMKKLKEKIICGVMDISNGFWDCFVRDGSSYMTSENLYDALEQEFTYQIQEFEKENK